MDKALTKKVVEGTGVRQARYYLALRYDFERNAEAVVAAAAETLGAFPVFVKPCSQGSSVGVAKANDLLELAEGLTEAFKLDTKVLVEEFIDGHEVECAVLGNLEPQASTVGEIAPTQEFYTFDAKYKDESSRLYIPAHITEEQIADRPSGRCPRLYRTRLPRPVPRRLLCHPRQRRGRFQRAECDSGLYLDQHVPQAV